jgi:hypothetical protein
MSCDQDKNKVYEKLIDCINQSKYYSQIPLPAILDNKLEELNEKYGYNKYDLKDRPNFEDEKEKIIKEEKLELSKKLKEKLKHLNKRRNREQKK